MIRAARSNIRYHLAYIGWLMRGRSFLAGERLSYADLAAAAHLSCADYFGDVPWAEAMQGAGALEHRRETGVEDDLEGVVLVRGLAGLSP